MLQHTAPVICNVPASLPTTSGCIRCHINLWHESNCSHFKFRSYTHCCQCQQVEEVHLTS
jgi:hypothetical protein